MELVETEEEEVGITQLQVAVEEAPVVKFINNLLADAVSRGASDIHIEPYEHNMRIRYRIDGVLHEVMKPPVKLRNAIASRVKIMAELDIAERRLPQDGRQDEDVTSRHRLPRRDAPDALRKKMCCESSTRGTSR